MIVGLCGYAGVGKDALADVLLRHGWVRVAFADRLKSDLEAAIGKPFLVMTPREKELWRPVLVAYGEARRRQDAGYWINEAERTILTTIGLHRNIVVTDVRYANEANWIRAQFGLVVRVARPGYAGKSTEERKSVPLVDCDLDLVNDSTLAAGRRKLLRLVRSWCLAHWGEARPVRRVA